MEYLLEKDDRVHYYQVTYTTLGLGDKACVTLNLHIQFKDKVRIYEIVRRTVSDVAEKLIEILKEGESD